MWLTPKIISAVVESCIRSPLTSRRIARLPTSPASSGVTSHGPSGLNVANDLPLTHCPPRSFWKCRSETSLATANPAMQELAAASSARYWARVPITTASSTSQSVCVLPGGSSTSSFGPTTDDGDLLNTTGSVGRWAPVSAAWSA